MSDQNNARCTICGKSYRVCNDCLEQKAFKPWRTVTDTIEHYQIYSVIHGYTITGDKDTARKELQRCNLSGKENFVPEIKRVINDILSGGYKDNRSNQQPKKNFGNLKSVDTSSPKIYQDTTKNIVTDSETTNDK